jgi:ABC-type lipoprotein release transport system permease subunit
VRNRRELPIIASKILELFPDTRPIIKDEILRTYDSVFNWRSGILVVILTGSVLAFIIFAWDKASGLSAEERKEIGILKAIGWETSDVIQMKFWEGTVVSLTSFLSGTLLAYVHVFFSSSVLFEPVLKGWAVIYPEFKLVPFIDPYQIAILFFLTVVPYTVSTIVPSWRAATVDPDSMMRA